MEGVEDATKLRLYGLTRHIARGDCGVTRPWVHEVRRRILHLAWESCRGMESTAAMAEFCSTLSRIAPEWDDGARSASAAAPTSVMPTPIRAAESRSAALDIRFAAAKKVGAPRTLLPALRGARRA